MDITSPFVVVPVIVAVFVACILWATSTQGRRPLCTLSQPRHSPHSTGNQRSRTSTIPCRGIDN